MGKQIVKQPRITRTENRATSIRITWSEMNVIEFSQNVSTESAEFSEKYYNQKYYSEKPGYYYIATKILVMERIFNLSTIQA